VAESVLIIGGGIIGLSCAWEAVKRGYRVTIVEKEAFGGQASGAAAGMLAPFSENPDGPDPFFQLCLDSHRVYPDWVREVEECSDFSVELCSTGSLNVALHESDLLPIQTRLLWQRKYGAACEWLGAAELRRLEPRLSPQAKGALYSPVEGHVYAPKLVQSLAVACRRAGVKLIPYAGNIERMDIGMASGPSVSMNAIGRITADRIVICTGAWSGMLEEWLPLSIPVHPIRGQICSYAARANDVQHMIFSSQAYWVGKKDGSLVCGASEDVAGFERTVTERGVERLTRWSGRLFPSLQDVRPQRSWAGLRPATRDGWPLIGPVPGSPEIILAAGHYRNGILLSPITATRVGDLLEGRTKLNGTVDLNAFDPGRFTSIAGQLR
jgi:glycine oxidase